MSVASAIVGWGTALPDTVVTNADLQARLDTSDEWIVERSGIRRRHIGSSVADLATEAARAALARHGVPASSIDLTIVATSTAEDVIPPAASVVQHRLGAGGGAVDVNGACAGFVPALVAAYGALALDAQRVLVVGADCMSRIVDPDDRSTAVLFADGAAAVLLQRTAGPAPAEGGPGLVSYDLGSDGDAHDLLYCRQGGPMVMNGRQVFRRAVRMTVDSATAALERAKLTIDDVALFVPHQANLRIIEAAGARLGIGPDRVAVVIGETGNTSAASVPLALAAALDAGRLRHGDLLLMTAVGAGMSWGSALVRWAS